MDTIDQSALSWHGHARTLESLPPKVMARITDSLYGAVLPLWLTGNQELQHLLSAGGVSSVNISTRVTSLTLALPACISHFTQLRSLSIYRSCYPLPPVQLLLKALLQIRNLEELQLTGANAEEVTVEFITAKKAFWGSSNANTPTHAPLKRLSIEAQVSVLTIDHLKELQELRILEIPCNTSVPASALPLLPHSLTRLHAPLTWTLSPHMPASSYPPRLKALTSLGTQPTRRILSRLPHSLTDLRLDWSTLEPQDTIFLPLSLETLDLSQVASCDNFSLEHLHLPLLRSLALPNGVDLMQAFTTSPTIKILRLNSPINWSTKLKSHFPRLRELRLLVAPELADQNFIDTLPVSLETLIISNARSLSDKALSALPSTLKSLSIEGKPDITSAGLAQLPIGLTHLSIQDTFDARRFPAQLTILTHLNLCGGRFFESLPTLPAGLSYLDLSQNVHLTSSVFHLLPRVLTSLLFRVPTSHREVEETDLSALPRGLNSLELLGSALVSDASMASLPSTLTFLRSIDCHSLTGQCFIKLPRFLRSLDLPFLTSLKAEELGDLPPSLTYLSISSQAAIRPPWPEQAPANIRF